MELGFALQTLLQVQYTTGVLTVNIEYMWFGAKRMERLPNARIPTFSKPRYFNFIFTVITPILYIKTFSCNQYRYLLLRLLTVHINTYIVDGHRKHK